MHSCSIDTLIQLEGLDFDLQSHCHALRLLAEDDTPEYADVRARLLLDRVIALEQTVSGFLTLEKALQL